MIRQLAVDAAVVELELAEVDRLDRVTALRAGLDLLPDMAARWAASLSSVASAAVGSFGASASVSSGIPTPCRA